jgi:hypothetical protein
MSRSGSGGAGLEGGIVSVRRRVCLAALTALVVLSSGLGLAAPVSADTTALLPFTSFSHVLADAHGHVYVTGGHGTDGIWVRNADGSADTTITSEPGASGMVLSSDGATLYVALSDGAAVSAIDTTTLTETRRYAAPASCPHTVAVVGAALWFDTDCAGQWATLGIADLATGTVSHSDQLTYYPFLLAVAGDPAGLVVQNMTSLGEIYRYDVSGGTMTQRASATGGYYGGDLALDPDGQHVVVGGGPTAVHLRLRLSDLTVDGSYASHTGQNSVATVPVLGGLVAAGVEGSSGDDIYIYRGGVLAGTVDFPSGDGLQAEGLAWSPDGSRLYAVDSSLHVITPPKAPSTLTLLAPATASRGVAYTLSGVLSTGGAVKPSTIVIVKRVDLTGTRTFPLTTKADGSYAYRDVPAVGGPVTWTVSWAGDATHAPVTMVRTVTVARAATPLSIAASASTYAYGAKATVTVHLGTTYNRRDVVIYARPLGTNLTAPGSVLAHVTVNAAGKAVVTYVMHRRTTFTVRFAGDYRYNSAARAVSPYVRAKVSLALSGYYARSGSTFLFHGKDPRVVASFAPLHAGSCFSTTVQAYQGGRWRTVASSGCLLIYADSRGYTTYLSSRAPGRLLRIRASAPDDTMSQSLGATSAWVSLRFT